MKRAWLIGFLFLLLALPALAEGASRSSLVATVVTRPTKLTFLNTFEVPKGVGSALIISAREGLLLAPAYLVQGAQWIDVILPRGRQLGARILAVDHLTGLAVLKTKSFGQEEAVFREDLPRVGERVWLIGRPRFSASVREALVTESPVRVVSRGIVLASFFAVDASLAGLGPAPVFDDKDRVVGFVLSLPNLTLGENTKVVPAYLMALVAEKAAQKGKIIWPWLGVEGVALNPPLAKALDLPARGLLITKVYPGSPAARVRIRGPRKLSSFGNLLWPVGGDVLVSFKGQAVASQAGLERLLFTAQPGELVELGLYRGKRLRKVKVYLGRRSFIQP